MLGSRVLPAFVALVSLTPTLAQNPKITGVVNAETCDNRLAPGVLAKVFGTDLIPGGKYGGGSWGGGCGLSRQTAGEGMPTKIGAPGWWSVRVLVNGLAAGIFWTCTDATPDLCQGQTVGVQLPVELRAGNATVVVEHNGVRSGPFDIWVDSYAPALGAIGVDPDGPVVELAGCLGPFVPRFREPPLPKAATHGQVVKLHAIGLGLTEPPVPQREFDFFVCWPCLDAPVVAQTRLTVGDKPAEVLFSGHSCSRGVYLVRFTVPDGLPEGTHPVVLEIGGKTSNTVYLPVKQTTPAISAVVNAAGTSRESVAAPGSILSVYGSNFASPDNLNAFPATEFAQLAVTFDGRPAPLFHVIASKSQINLLAPTELPESGTVNVRVRKFAKLSADFPLKMVSASPGIFRIYQSYAAAVSANTAWFAIPRSIAQTNLGMPTDCAARGIQPKAVCGEPAKPGDVIQIYVTGLGKVTPGGNPNGPPLPSGSVAPPDGNPLYLTVARPVVTVGDVAAEMLFSGLVPGFSGLYQVNLSIPGTAPSGDRVPVKIAMPNGRTDTALIAIQR